MRVSNSMAGQLCRWARDRADASGPRAFVNFSDERLMHVSSTGSLVALSPPAVTAQQEATRYGIYAVILWVVVVLLVLKDGLRLNKCDSDENHHSGSESHLAFKRPMSSTQCYQW